MPDHVEVDGPVWLTGASGMAVEYARVLMRVRSVVVGRGAAFSYHANWTAPGRWRVDVMSSARRFFLCLLETLQIPDKGHTDWRAHALDDALKRESKSGIFRMVEAFLRGGDRRLCRVEEQAARLRGDRAIAGLAAGEREGCGAPRRFDANGRPA